MRGKIYLAGPMRGIEDLNYPAFSRKAYELRKMGYEVFNPAEHDNEMEKQKIPMTINNCLKDDLTWICNHATTIYMMKGWEKSLGAIAEHATAVALGLNIIYE